MKNHRQTRLLAVLLPMLCLLAGCKGLSQEITTVSGPRTEVARSETPVPIESRDVQHYVVRIRKADGQTVSPASPNGRGSPPQAAPAEVQGPLLSPAPAPTAPLEAAPIVRMEPATAPPMPVREPKTPASVGDAWEQPWWDWCQVTRPRPERPWWDWLHTVPVVSLKPVR